MDDSQKPEILCLSGGNIKGFIQAGIIDILLQNKYLNCVKKYIGTSIGSVISLLLNMEVDRVNFIPLLYDIHIDKLFEKINFKTILSVPSSYGFVDIKTLFTNISEYMKGEYGKILTMKDLHDETDKELEIITYNLSKKEKVSITYKSHPDLSCIDAIAMSCNIPIMFTKIEYNNDIYIDGVYSGYFPNTTKRILCVVTTSKEHHINDIIGYIHRIYTNINAIDYDEVLSKLTNNYDVVLSECYDIELLTIDKDTQIQKLYNYGLNLGYEFYKVLYEYNNEDEEARKEKCIIYKDNYDREIEYLNDDEETEKIKQEKELISKMKNDILSKIK